MQYLSDGGGGGETGGNGENQLRQKSVVLY